METHTNLSGKNITVQKKCTKQLLTKFPPPYQPTTASDLVDHMASELQVLHQLNQNGATTKHSGRTYAENKFNEVTTNTSIPITK